MIRDLGRLSSHTFDVVVVGGGITGACIAHDAALRGLSVALFEKGDFGGATSAASSKLLHGGIRYLQQAQFGKVRESASERTAFLQVAPHLVRWVPFLIPTTRSLTRGSFLLRAGIHAFHVTCAGTSRGLRDPQLQVPRDYFLPRQALLSRFPSLGSLDDVTGAGVIHEAHMRNSERMTLAFLKSAASRGATVANYAEVTRFLEDGARVTGVEVLDRTTGSTLEVAARVVLNAAGPWIGALNSLLGKARLERSITAFSKGVHLVTRPLLDDAALALPTRQRSQAVIQRGGRHYFAIPWRGCSLIGTTNVPFDHTPDQLGVTHEDVVDFIADLNTAWPAAALTERDVRYAFAGLYPLTEEDVRPDVYQGTGMYQLVDHATADGLEGIVSVLGAKYTTARRLAERAVDRLGVKLGRRLPRCTTRETPVAGGDIPDLASFRRDVIHRHAPLADPDTLEHLIGAYGTEVDAVLRLGTGAPGGLGRLVEGQPTVEAEVRFAVQHEMAVTLDDVVFRRTGLGTVGYPGRACLERCADIMAETFSWDTARIADEIARVERRYAWRPSAPIAP